MPSLLRPVRFGILTVFAFSLLACNVSETEPSLSKAPSDEPARPMLSLERSIRRAPRLCAVDVPATVEDLRASAWGLAYVTVPRAGGVVVHRLEGSGCALQETSDPVAARGLLDFDDGGSLYVLDGASTSRGALSSEVPGQTRGANRVDLAANVDPVIPEGRGIWGFSVDPSGEELWVSACGPTGFYSVANGASDASFALPDTLWAQRESVLTARDTFWSVGYRTCDPAEPLTEACGYALMRTTRGSVAQADMRGQVAQPETTIAVGSTVINFGSGAEPLTLARCGEAPCGFSPNGVVVWNRAGNTVWKLDRAALGAHDDELIETASGSQTTVYVLLRSAHGTRVLAATLDP